MKWYDRNIDQLFRDAAQNKPAPEYKSSYWNDVSSVLDAEQRRKKGLILWSLGGGAVLAVLFTILFYGSPFHVEAKRYAKHQGNELNPEKHYSIIDSFHPKANLGVSNNGLEKSYATNDESHRQSVNNKNANTLDLESEKGLQNNVLESEDTEGKNINKTMKTAYLVDSASENEKSVTPIQEELKKSTVIEEATNNELATTITVLPIRELNFVPLNDIEGHIAANQRNWYLSAEVNMGVMENYETSRPFDSGIMNFALKGGYERSNIRFNTGIGIQVSTNSDLVVSQRAKYYGFGVVNHQTDLSYQEMYDLYIPIEIGYHQNKTIFGIGLQANYLINTSMQLRKYEDNELIRSENINGYSNGLTKFSAQGYLWISQQLSSRFSAGLKIGTNFTNRIKEGDYFNESATTNPIFGQVSLRYNIFK